MDSLKVRLSHAMQEAGIPSQRQLAFKAKLRPATITRWVSEETKSIRPNDLGSVCAILGVRPDWLILGVGPMKEEGVSEAKHIPYSVDGLTPAKRIILRALEAEMEDMTDEQAEAWFIAHQKAMDKKR